MPDFQVNARHCTQRFIEGMKLFLELSEYDIAEFLFNNVRVNDDNDASGVSALIIEYGAGPILRAYINCCCQIQRRVTEMNYISENTE